MELMVLKCFFLLIISLLSDVQCAEAGPESPYDRACAVLKTYRALLEEHPVCYDYEKKFSGFLYKGKIYKPSASKINTFCGAGPETILLHMRYTSFFDDDNNIHIVALDYNIFNPIEYFAGTHTHKGFTYVDEVLKFKIGYGDIIHRVSSLVEPIPPRGFGP